VYCLPALLQVIKTSRIPIICICNDRQSTKIRSLANHCYDLRVSMYMSLIGGSGAIECYPLD
jgi:hypothetical protein